MKTQPVRESGARATRPSLAPGDHGGRTVEAYEELELSVPLGKTSLAQSTGLALEVYAERIDGTGTVLLTEVHPRPAEIRENRNITVKTRGLPPGLYRLELVARAAREGSFFFWEGGLLRVREKLRQVEGGESWTGRT